MQGPFPLRRASAQRKRASGTSKATIGIEKRFWANSVRQGDIFSGSPRRRPGAIAANDWGWEMDPGLRRDDGFLAYWLIP
jgi:hypothetical protein